MKIKTSLNKKTFLLILFSLSLIGCSTSRYNTYITSPLTVEKLKRDVDKAQRILVKYQPKLDWYIASDSLNAKFESLRNSLIAQQTSKEFFEDLSPVIYSVRQGHNRLRPAPLKQTSQQKAIGKGIIAPIAQFEYIIDDNRLFIAKNQSNDSTIQAGTEIITINGESSQELLQKCYSLFTSDGYNITFFPRYTAVNFHRIYHLMYPEFVDSINFSFKSDENVRELYVNSVKKKTEQKKTDARTLSFLTADSTVAMLKISTFSSGNYRTFYAKSFATLSAAKTQTLVLDLRNNQGGSLSEITYLYSFLTDSAFTFIDKAEITSPFIHAFHGKSLGNILSRRKSIFSKIISTLTYPLAYTTSSIVDLSSISKKQNGKYNYSYSSSKSKRPNKNGFTGKLFVLANGGSFSASCILLSNLQGSKRAFVVGEETGGAYNGTVAGRMITKTLPASKLKLTVGMSAIQPYYKSDIEGRGIFPDKEIVPTIEDLINQNDPELEWIMNQIILNKLPSQK